MGEIFLCDSMLGDVKRWLRLLGYEAVDPEDLGLKDDRAVIQACVAGEWILLTRDRELVARASREGARVLLVPDGEIEEVLAWLSIEGGVSLEFEPLRSRCPECGGRLDRIRPGTPEEIPEWVPRDRDLYVCRSCGKIYWEGRQTARVRETLLRASLMAESFKIDRRDRIGR